MAALRSEEVHQLILIKPDSEHACAILNQAHPLDLSGLRQLPFPILQLLVAPKSCDIRSLSTRDFISHITLTKNAVLMKVQALSSNGITRTLYHENST